MSNNQSRLEQIADKVCSYSVEYRQWGYEDDSCGSYEYEGDADSDIWFLIHCIIQIKADPSFLSKEESSKEEIEKTENAMWASLYQEGE